MKKEIILKELTQDEKEGNGEILFKNKYGVLYYDYDSSVETYYRYGEYCTKSILEKNIIIGTAARKLGITKSKVANLIIKAFGSEIEDAICTLNNIGIFFGEEDFDEVLKEANDRLRTGEDLTEWYCYEDYDELCGNMLFAHQMPMINVKEIYKTTMEISQKYSYSDEIDLWDFEKEFNIGLSQTIVHELRHCMMDTNLFLPEIDYPIEEAEEENVEDFCIRKVDNMPYNVVSIVKIKEIKDIV